MNQLQMLESQPLRCPMIEKNARARAVFYTFPRKARKSWTGWRRRGDSNPRDPSDFRCGVAIVRFFEPIFLQALQQQSLIA